MRSRKLEWRWVVGYEGKYKISSDGWVKSVRRVVVSWRSQNFVPERILSVFRNEWGYSIVSLSKEAKQKTYTVHRLVALAFLANPLGLPEVNHKNGVKTDNSVSNLEWIDGPGNKAHAKKMGLGRWCRGTEVVTSKLVESDVREIKRRLSTGRETHRMIAADFGVVRTAITAIANRRTWAHVK